MLVDKLSFRANGPAHPVGLELLVPAGDSEHFVFKPVGPQILRVE